MGQVIALDLYRNTQPQGFESAPVTRPHFSAGDVWGRDYTQEEAILFGILKAREALRYYTPYEDWVDGMLLEVLDAAYHIADTGPDRLRTAIDPLKDYILRHMDEESARHLKTALILLDLIEKSPTYK